MYNDSARETVFKNIPLSYLNDLLAQTFINKNIFEYKEKITEETHKIIECKKTIEESEKQIADLKQKILKESKNVDKDYVSSHINPITEEIINSSDPDTICKNAISMLVGKDGNDMLIDINKLKSLTETEKEELYRAYIDIFKKLSGII